MPSSEAEFEVLLLGSHLPFTFLSLRCWHEYSNVFIKYMFLGETDGKAVFGITGKVFSHTLDRNYHFSFKSKSQSVSNFFNAFIFCRKVL